MASPVRVRDPRALIPFLQRGEVVAVPTDTVMGLVGIPSEETTRRIFQVKGRPEHKPLVLFHHRDLLFSRYAPEPREAIERLVQQFWPGPLTLVLHLSEDRFPPLLHNPEGGIALRHPAHPFPEILLKIFPEGLASTSANRSGAPPARTPEEVMQTFGREEVAALLDAPAAGRSPSTLLDLNATPPRLHRPGPVPLRALEQILGQEIRWAADRPFRVLFVCSGNTCRSPMAEHLLRHALADLITTGRLEIASAGTLGLTGGDATPEVYQVLQEIGIVLAHHTRTPLTADNVQQADLILVMEPHHLDAVRDKGGEDRAAHLAEAPVPDPIGLGLPTYRMVRDMIQHALEQKWIPYLRRKLEGPP
jgi:tRNA threonylcarbamoyl adenosine modification protein (Sua5/YciO/YrdC/YwlC family)